MKSLRFSILPGEWAIVRLAPEAPIPPWTLASAAFCSITRTANELSIVASTSAVPVDVRAEGGGALLKQQGPFALAALLAARHIEN